MKTEDQICRSLIEMMKETPFDQIKVTELSEHCGISRSTFYFYFDSTHTVLQRIEDCISESFLFENKLWSELTDEEMRKIFYNLSEKIDTFYILTGPNGDPSFKTKLANRNKRVLLSLASEMKSGVSDIEIQIISEFTFAGKIQTFQWWATHKNYVSVNDMFVVLKKLMTQIHNILKN